MLPVSILLYCSRVKLKIFVSCSLHQQEEVKKIYQSKIEPYFKFWKATEIHDLKLRARNYLIHEVISESYNATVKPYAPSHMQMRKLFGSAKFIVDISEVEHNNPFKKFESLATRNRQSKEYSLHKIPKSNGLPQYPKLAKELHEEMKQYIYHTHGKDKIAIPSNWCIYCVHRGTCMESFLTGE